MKKAMGMIWCTMVMTFLGLPQAQADLIEIGTARFNHDQEKTEYRLIWDSDNNGKSLVWLDYTYEGGDWQAQKNWAAGLNNDNVLTYKYYQNYEVAWEKDVSGDTAFFFWRLPDAAGATTGYGKTDSEMGHLYRTELKNIAKKDDAGMAANNYGLKNKGPFVNLKQRTYFFETGDYGGSGNYWAYDFETGYQGAYVYINPNGIAVREAVVTVLDDGSQVPVPGTIELFCIGLLGLTGIRRGKRAR